MRAEATVLDSAVRKATRRLLPFLMLLYIASFLDRVNIGYVKAPFLRDTGLDEWAYAFGAGIFFVGYSLLEVPSNLALFRFGARAWIGRIMISWGVVAAALMFVRGAASFYGLRATLGAMEAGFFPGVIYYLSGWFPERQRGPMIGLFYFGAPCAQILGGPVSGLLLDAEGVGGLHGWQWVFLCEGLLAVVLGVVTLCWLTDRPADAQWLTPAERQALVDQVSPKVYRVAPNPVSESALIPSPRRNPTALLANPRIWYLSLIYFLIQLSVYGVTFYLPSQVSRLLSLKVGLTVGLVSAIPWCFAVLAAYLLPRLSTNPRNAGRSAALVLVAAAVGIYLGSTSAPLLGLAALCLATGSFIGVQPIFWTIPTAELSGAQAAAGIALINSLGALGGLVAPNLRVAAEKAWASPSAGATVLAATTLVGAVLVARVVPRAANVSPSV